MECVHHRNRHATNTCYKCGAWICDDCVMESGGRILCGECADVRRCAPLSKERRTNGFLFFLLSGTVPGINFMYLGMMKRGLFFLSSFFLTITLLVMFEIWQLSFVLGIMYVASFFDGYAKRRMINAGEYVPDSVEDIMSFIRNYKFHMILVVGGLAVLNVLSNMYRKLLYGHYGSGIIRHIPEIMPFVCILIIIYGIYMIGKSKGRRRNDDD